MVALVYEESFPETVESHPELVAPHFTEAGSNQQVIAYWQKAGQIAAGRTATVEAVNHLTTGLRLLETLLDTLERATQELALQAALGNCLVQARGYTFPEARQRFRRAQELIEQVGETSEYTRVMFGIISFHLIRTDYKSCGELAQQFLAAAHRSKEPGHLQLGHSLIGCPLFYRGELVSAL